MQRDGVKQRSSLEVHHLRVRIAHDKHAMLGNLRFWPRTFADEGHLPALMRPTGMFALFLVAIWLIEINFRLDLHFQDVVTFLVIYAFIIFVVMTVTSDPIRSYRAYVRLISPLWMPVDLALWLARPKQFLRVKWESWVAFVLTLNIFGFLLYRNLVNAGLIT